MHYNIKNILYNYGFDNNLKYDVVYIKLYEAIANAIINKSFKENTKLPPTRILAQDLGISRSTVVKAYDLLLIEKYIYTIPGSGNFVASSKNKKIHIHLKKPRVKGKYPAISKHGKSFKKNSSFLNKEDDKGIAFRPGLPPLDLFPVQKWQHLSNIYWKTIKSSELSYSNTIGLLSLRENISNYLRINRNINCTPEQIIITTGSLHSLYLLGSVILDKNNEVVIENPTYPHAYNLFKSLRANIFPASVDSEGISVDSILSKNPKVVYTTPSNQYPSGIKMSMKRRMSLLNWASKNNAFVIEDDYDHEFSNWENPLASIYSLDNQSRVIYLGTFNKLLHPSIRIGYMIVPHYLLDYIDAVYQQSSRFVPPSAQKILNSFIEKGYLNSHLRNLIQASIYRKKVFSSIFSKKFSEYFTIDTKPLGLHVIAKSNELVNDTKIASDLLKAGITAHPYSKYFLGNTSKSGLVMGYASVNNKLIEKNLDKMDDALIY